MSALSRPLFDSGNLHLFIQLAVEQPGALERHFPAVMACLRADVRVEQAMHALLVAAQQAPAAARPSNCELISSYFSAIGSPNDGCFHGYSPDELPPAHECAGCGTEQHQFVESPARVLARDDEGEAYDHEDRAHGNQDDEHGCEVAHNDDVAIANGTSPSATILPAPINTCAPSPPATLELPLSPCFVTTAYVSPLIGDADFDEGPATPLDLHSDLDAEVGIVCPISPFATPLDLSSHFSRGLPPPTPSYTTMPRVMRVPDSEDEDVADENSGSPSPAPSLVFDSCPSSPSPGPVRRSQRLRHHSPYLRPSTDQKRKPKARIDRDVSPFDLDDAIYAFSPKVAADLLYTPPVYAPEAFSTTRGGCDELFLYSSSSESESESGSGSDAPSPSSSCASSRASSPRSRASRSPRFDPLARGWRRVARTSV